MSGQVSLGFTHRHRIRGPPSGPCRSTESRSFYGSYLIRVWGSVSMEGGPLVRRDGFTNTPWPGGQRKYTLPWTVPLCLPGGRSIVTLRHFWTFNTQEKTHATCSLHILKQQSLSNTGFWRLTLRAEFPNKPGPECPIIYMSAGLKMSEKKNLSVLSGGQTVR